jgi:hypothetical protein
MNMHYWRKRGDTPDTLVLPRAPDVLIVLIQQGWMRFEVLCHFEGIHERLLGFEVVAQ